MHHSKLAKVAALILVLAVVTTMPLAGCGKPTESVAEEPGGETSSGGTSAGSGSGGSGSGGAGSGGSGSGGTTGDAAGADPSTGSELGPWGTEWNAQFAAGQHYKYVINIGSDDGTVTSGWYSLTFSDAGGGNLKIDYAGNIGLDFSGSFVSDADDINWGEGLDFMAWGMLLGLMATPALYLGMTGRSSWDTGTTWSWGEGDDKVTFAITGKRAYAKITGAVGEWRCADGSFAQWCVNPKVPLALYVKIADSEKSYMEYILVECAGF